MMRKLTVITDDTGRVVATQVGHGDNPRPVSGTTGRVVAGPGQHEYKIEYELPTHLTSRSEIEAFHESLRAFLADQP